MPLLQTDRTPAKCFTFFAFVLMISCLLESTLLGYCPRPQIQTGSSLDDPNQQGDPSNPTREAFAQQVIDALSKVTEAKFDYSADEFQLEAQGSKENKINLGNVYQEHLALDPSERPANLIKIARVFTTRGKDLPESFEDAKAHLIPKIWSRGMFEFAKLRNRVTGGPAMDLPLNPLGEHLFSTLVYDTEHAMRSLSNKDLENWGVSREEAMEIACDNLQKLTVSWSKIGDGFYVSMSGDSFDSSRVLLPKVQALGVKGKVVALLPIRDLLHVAGSDDPESLKMMFDLAKLDERGRPLSPLPLIFEGGTWKDWEPPSDHLVRPIYDLARREFFAQLYRQQQDLLNKAFMHEQVDVFVASFSALQNPTTKEIWTYCVWSEGVDSLLPKTDIVVLMGSDKQPAAIGKWDHIRNVVGELIEVDDTVYPTRFRVKKFPDREKLEAIGMIKLK